MIVVEADVGESWPTQPEGDWQSLARRAVEAAVLNSPWRTLADKTFAAEVSVKFAEDDEVRHLNAAYRQQDKPTNVLSFPMVQRDLLDALANTDDGEALLGDVVLARGVCMAEAEEKGVPIATHASHLIVHGTYHLLGYDHLEGAEAEEMESLEREALASLGIADPYAVGEA